WRPRSLLRLRAVLRSTLLAPADARGVERAASDVIAHAREALDAASADQNDRVLLEVVSFARDVARHLDAVREPDAGDLAERRVRLLGRRRVDARTDPPLLRAGLERRSAGLASDLPPPVADELVQSGPRYSSKRLKRVGLRGQAGHGIREGTTCAVTAQTGQCKQWPTRCQAVFAPSSSTPRTAACFSDSSRIRRYPCMPVPAGIRWPMMTFSLRPRRLSILPWIAASVSTRVVSWKEAAEMKLSVESEALVIPSSSGWNVAGCWPSRRMRSFSSSTMSRSTGSPSRNVVSPGSSIRTF